MTNRYFLCERGGFITEFTMKDSELIDRAIIRYFTNSVVEFERAYCVDNYTFCFAWSAKEAIPCVGNNVVVILYGEEHCRIPRYTAEVKAVFKGIGVFPKVPYRVTPIRLAQIELVEFVRNVALWLPNGWRWLFSKEVRRKCHIIPIGYGKEYSFTNKDFDQRKYITSFQGSLAHQHLPFLRRVIGVPKLYARNAAVTALKKLQTKYGSSKVAVILTGGFQESMARGTEAFAQVQEETMICIAPRGTTQETLRPCIGLRYGCIVISDKLPNHPFYRDSPIIQIHRWQELERVVEGLLSDPGRMKALHHESIKHWEQNLSERALARMIAEGIGITT